jgi:hypothetical protein
MKLGLDTEHFESCHFDECAKCIDIQNKENKYFEHFDLCIE